jgi:hypothetical protein
LSNDAGITKQSYSATRKKPMTPEEQDRYHLYTAGYTKEEEDQIIEASNTSGFSVDSIISAMRNLKHSSEATSKALNRIANNLNKK